MSIKSKLKIVNKQISYTSKNVFEKFFFSRINKTQEKKRIAFSVVPKIKEGYVNHLRKDDKILLSRIKIMLSLSEKQFDTLIEPILQRFVDYTFFVPASQIHHHAYHGGLLTHSLEVSLYLLLLTEDEVNHAECSPEKRKKQEQKWKVILLLAGLCHDFGKLFTDFTVRENTTNDFWDPFYQSFKDWSASYELNHLQIDWRKGRHKSHEAFSGFSCYFLMTPELINWLTEYGFELLETLFKGVSLEDKQNELTELILVADQNSVEKNLKVSSSWQYEQFLDKNRLLVIIEQIVQELIINRVWQANQKGARLWMAYEDGKQNLYLVWSNASKELIEILADNYSVYSYKEEELLEILCQLGFFKYESIQSPLIKMSPECLWQSTKKIYLSMIQIAQPQEILTLLSQCGELPFMSFAKWVDKQVLDENTKADHLVQNALLSNENLEEIQALNLGQIIRPIDESIPKNQERVSKENVYCVKPPFQGAALNEKNHKKAIFLDVENGSENHKMQGVRKNKKQVHFNQIILTLCTEFQEIIKSDEHSITFSLNDLRAAYQRKGYDDDFLVKTLLNHKKSDVTELGDIMIKMNQSERLALFDELPSKSTKIQMKD